MQKIYIALLYCIFIYSIYILCVLIYIYILKKITAIFEMGQMGHYGTVFLNLYIYKYI